MRQFKVSRLQLDSVVDESPDPYGRPGFTTLSAYVFKEDREVFAALRSANGNSENITIRCGGLEIEGQVNQSNLKQSIAAKRIEIIVSVVRQRKGS